MQISLEWLSEFVELPDTEQLCELLTNAGIEVEAVDDPRQASTGVIVGEVSKCDKHPEADKLSVCEVTDGQHSHRVVCGAANVAAGQRVAFAPVGARVGTIEIGRRKLRGVESAGMICSREELGLDDKSDGIWVLPASSVLGQGVYEAANVREVLTLGITPNRPDLLSHVGVAREVAAATKQRLKGPTLRVTEKGPEVGSLARIVIDAPLVCRRYAARVVQNIEVGPSPQWLRQRLEAVGQRSVNNVVDVTNYVLFELGQPLHAFDLTRLGIESGLPTIRVRMAEPDERMTTLDDVERELIPEDLLIADAGRPVAIAGVMGGADSEVSDTTTAVLIESAHFDPVAVRRTARRLGLSTEASRRFERGADWGVAAKAADRCAQLLAEVAGGQIAKGQLDVGRKDKDEGRSEIVVRLARIPRVLGVDMSAENVVQLLEPLAIRCTGRSEGALHFEPPTFRPDLEREIDLIEEIARRYGYDAIPERMPNASGEFVYEPAPERLEEKARTALIASGCSEVITFGFGSPRAYAPFASEGEAEPIRMLNPLGEEFSALRTSLLPGLLSVLGRNQRQGMSNVRIFELGFTVHRRAENSSDPERDRDLPRERKIAGILMCGGRCDSRWYEGGEKVELSDLVGVIENLTEKFDRQADLRLEPATLAGFNPHAAATVNLGDDAIGTVGQIHPVLVHDLELEGPVFAAQIDLDDLAAAQERRGGYRALPRLPGTRRDIAVIVSQGTPAESIRRYLLEYAGGELGSSVVERVRLFDVYQGKPIAADKVSLAFAIEYRHPERTLTDDEVGKAFEAVVSGVTAHFEAETR